VIKMVQKIKKKFEAIRVTQETHQEAKFIADKSGKSISATVSELLDAVFNIAVTYEDINLTYEYDGDSVKVIVSGRNNMICGEQKMPAEVLKEESKAKPLLRVKTKDSKEYKEVDKP
jgi:hypothetical protein